MSTQAELVKDSMQRIIRLETALEREPESKEIKRLLAEERALLEEMKKSN
jgi:hypothetical protein